jgi:hypothetical protein
VGCVCLVQNGKNRPKHSILGDDHVSTQINLYILSRVIIASVNNLLQPAKLPSKFVAVFLQKKLILCRLFAGFCWGTVMALFFLTPNALQPSLRMSMQKLYIDTDKS